MLEVTEGLTNRFSVAIESQPAVLTRVTEYVPAALYEFPFQEYGSAASQIVTTVLEVTDGLTNKFRVAIESQPAKLVRVTEYVPAAL